MFGKNIKRELDVQRNKSEELSRKTIRLERELAELKIQKRKGLRGIIEDDLDLQESFDVLNMLSSTRKTGTWKIDTYDGRVFGTLYIQEGEIVQACYTCDSLTEFGELAIGKILTSYSSTKLVHEYSFTREEVNSAKFPIRGRIKNPQSLIAYVMDAFRKQDEASK